MYQNLQQYAKYVQDLSQSIMGIKGYNGVQMSAHTNTINVWDNTSSLGTVAIEAIDLVGQPTWIDIQMINIKTVLRGDIHCGMTVTLPPTLVNLTAQAIIPGAPASEQRTNTTFSGLFKVYRVLHIGDFRNPDGAGWTSNFECLAGGSGPGNIPAGEGSQ